MNLNIHPLLLGHPVNCRLMLASENSKKNFQSSLTLEVLHIFIHFASVCMQLLKTNKLHI
jgi:hypothetical protein